MLLFQTTSYFICEKEPAGTHFGSAGIERGHRHNAESRSEEKEALFIFCGGPKSRGETYLVFHRWED